MNRTIIIAIFAFLAAIAATMSFATPIPPVRTDTPVRVVSYSGTSGVLVGMVSLQNIAPVKKVTVVYADKDGQWKPEYQFPAQFQTMLPGSNNQNELWSFYSSGPFVKGVSAFYVRYEVAGKTYYDSQESQNYPVDIEPSTRQ
ncbi:hypothetical protein HK102_006429 [Quaeritorhiza haematococci]|nr:hypothetical protein HK102_006429 [Quaeritorhiza haematococci]